MASFLRRPYPQPKELKSYRPALPAPWSRFLGYAKPTLSLADREIQIENVPVPRRAYLLPWFTQNSGLLDELRSFAAIRSLVRKLTPSETSDGRLSDSVRVALAAFEQLATRNPFKTDYFLDVAPRKRSP